jgi:N-methylhydantoinase B
MGGRPKSDGPDTVEELMRNTRNNPLEDLGMHLPLICDRYELRDDVMPGAGRFRGGQGVVKAQRFLTPGFITHESDRHDDAPWGVFGGKPGSVGKYEIHNAKSPKDIQQYPAKFSGLRVSEGDVASYFSPSGGGYGNPIDRPAEQVLEDVLDDFITPEHAREAYGVVLKPADNGFAWALDADATTALRASMAS